MAPGALELGFAMGERMIDTPTTAASDAGVSEMQGGEVQEGAARPRPVPERRTPEEWAQALGYVGKRSSLTINGQRRPTPFQWQHAAADQLHGWSLHKQHTVELFKLTRAAYEAALQAASKPSGRTYQAHSAALSPFCNRNRGH